MSTPSPNPSLDPYLCCTFSGSTPSQVPVTYMSHLRWWGSNLSLDTSPVLFIPILFPLCLHMSYIFTFQVQFWYPWMTILNSLFYVDLETSSKMKLICIPTHYYWSIPFSAVNSILYNFFTCMPDICSWSTNYSFLQVLPYSFYQHMSNKVRSIFVSCQLHLQIHL